MLMLMLKAAIITVDFGRKFTNLRAKIFSVVKSMKEARKQKNTASECLYLEMIFKREKNGVSGAMELRLA